MTPYLLETQTRGKCNGEILVLYLKLSDKKLDITAVNGEVEVVEMEIPNTSFVTLMELIDTRKVEAWRRTGKGLV